MAAGGSLSLRLLPVWLTRTAGTGLTGITIVVPPEGSPEHQRIGQTAGISFLTEDVRSLFQEWSRQGICFPLPPMQPSWGSGRARYAVFEDVDGNRFSVIEFDEATRTLEAERGAQAARLQAERQAVHDLAIAKQAQARLFPNASRRCEHLSTRGFAILLGPSVGTITAFLISAAEGSAW